MKEMKDNFWITVDSTLPGDLANLYKQYNIDKDIIKYSLDQNERAHFSFDKPTQTFVLIYNIPNKNKVDNHYETVPITFVLKKDIIITITNKTNQYIIEQLDAFLKQNPNISSFEFLFSSLFIITDTFFGYVDEMNAGVKEISSRLKVKTSKTKLLLLSDLETGVLFFEAAAKQNAVVLDQIKNHTIYKQLKSPEIDELDDAMIEAKQLVEMTNLTSNMLEKLAGTYNNILNNNLNDTMRILTVLSILLTVPTIITGFFGMNMPLPLEHNIFGWVITILISAILWFALSFILRKMMK